MNMKKNFNENLLKIKQKNKIINEYEEKLNHLKIEYENIINEIKNEYNLNIQNLKNENIINKVIKEYD